MVDYVTPVNGLYNKVFYVIMNQDKWASLPDEVKAAITRVNKSWAEKAGKIWTSHMDEGLEFAVKKHGVKVIELDGEEHAKWMKQLQPIVDKFGADMEKKGLPGKATVDLVFKLADQASAKY